jgi:hypothetical protein
MKNESISYFKGTSYDAHNVLNQYENNIKFFKEKMLEANVNKDLESEKSWAESLVKAQNNIDILKKKLNHYYFEIDFDNYNDKVYETAYFISYVAYYNGEVLHIKDVFNTVVYFDSRDNITSQDIQDLEESLLKDLQKENSNYDTVQILSFNKLH